MDIVLRALFAFLFIFLLTRIIGRRELNTLQPFDLILLVLIGDLVQQGITQSDYSLTGLTLAVGTVALLTVAFSYTSFRFPRARQLIDGEPIVIVRDGKPIEGNLRRERLTVEDVEEPARLQQIASLDAVSVAVLENDGQISFIC
jgi:uncharacterized membrane protein YcaP (DUF421 family)